MDEGLLNDLLECSVCLERLDTSSRVLPCQHTFCLKCLKVIVESHKELRCPECRVLVEAKVEELPPNVLLMRILEGMRNSSTPRKPSASTQKALRAGLHQQHAPNQPVTGSDGKLLPPHARALYDYRSKEIGDLSFKKGETIFLHKRLDPFWYQGECGGRAGLLPATYVQVVVPLPTPAALCKALYDFRMSAPDEEGCLAFDKGAIISVHRRVDENWAEGRLEERVGIFPIAFVEPNAAARLLMNSPTINRPVPPLPEHLRAGHSELRHLPHQHNHRFQQMSMSTPTTAPQTYQNVATMSQSQPSYNQPTQPPIMVPPMAPMANMAPIANMAPMANMGQQIGILTAVPRNIIDTAKHSELIHFTNLHNKSGHQTVGLQSVSRINDNFERLRNAKYEYNTTPIHKTESTYQNVRTHEHFPVTVANFNTQSSDSSSSGNTPSVGVSSPNTPNTSDTSTSEEPSLPSSPDNQERPADETPELNSSMGVLSLNESSTATNTSLNVSLPPSESPNTTKNEPQAQQERKTDSNQANQTRLDAPSSSKSQPRSGPDSLMNFGLGLQAALSPSHGNDNHLNRREKRHSLTPSTHLGTQHSSQNRHSAEILATSLLDTGGSERGERSERGSERGERSERRRRRRSRSSERPLPAPYVALYAYRPQKPDELELKKGCVYMVTERCRDGWFKGRSERTQRAGVFPGNYVAAATMKLDPEKQIIQPTPSKPALLASATAPGPPLAPPRENEPKVAYVWGANGVQQIIVKEKPKDKSKPSSLTSGVNLMKRLAAMKRARSPPPPGYSCDNPVFEDAAASATPQPPPHVHVRSGSCPSQLLGAAGGTGGASGGTLGAGGSQRIRTKERPALSHDYPPRGGEAAWPAHRKSQSLDVTATRRDRHHSQPVKERFRCIVPYPPNSEYELELQLDDVVLVTRKRADGWYKGTLQRTGRTGLFPASFVQSCPE